MTEQCLDDASIVALAEGQLQGDDLEDALGHIEQCSLCAELVSNAARLLSDNRTRLGRYVILDEARRGGTGLTLLAYDPKLRREVALKIVQTDQRQDPRAALRILREARILADLHHPGVLPVYEAHYFGDQVFIAMEHAPGVSLQAWLAQERRAPSEILGKFLEVGWALAAAHRVGVVHRDVRPTNVIVTDDGRVLAIDFGIALAPSDATGRGDFITSGSTDSATSGSYTIVVDSPLYLAPEQFFGAIDARSDQYAFCLALLEALHGSWPLSTSDPQGMRRVKMGGSIEAQVWAGLPPRWAKAIARGLAPCPDDRWPSMDELCAALSQKHLGGRRGDQHATLVTAPAKAR